MSTEQSPRTLGTEDVADPNDVNQRRRLEAIQTARQRVLEQRRHGLDLFSQKRISRFMLETIVREAVQDYVLELETMLRSRQEGDPYWSDLDLGELSIERYGTSRRYVGLESFVDEENPVVIQWVEEPDVPPGYSTHPDPETQSGIVRTEQLQIPVEVSMQAYRAANRFLGDINLDARLDEIEAVGGEVASGEVIGGEQA